MPIRKIADLPKICSHPEHHPPSHVSLEDGLYEHTCPECGRTRRFRVDHPKMQAEARARLHAISRLPDDVRRRYAGCSTLAPSYLEQVYREAYSDDAAHSIELLSDAETIASLNLNADDLEALCGLWLDAKQAQAGATPWSSHAADVFTKRAALLERLYRAVTGRTIGVSVDNPPK